MRTLTLKQLTEAHACPRQVKLFKEHFGESVVVTEELAESSSQIFDFDWAGRNLLSNTVYPSYIRAHAAAQTKYAEAAVYDRDKYERACEPARPEYEESGAAAHAEYQKVRRAGAATYRKVCATTFARLYNTDTAPEAVSGSVGVSGSGSVGVSGGVTL